MKTKTKKIKSDLRIIHSSANFSIEKASGLPKEKRQVPNFLEELNNAIRWGDDSAWRMWR